MPQDKPWPECEHYTKQFKGCSVNGQTFDHQNLPCPSRLGRSCPVARAHWDGVKVGYDEGHRDGVGFFDYVVYEAEEMDG